MHKKNYNPQKSYISRQEYEVWQYLQDKEIVDGELLQQVFPDLPANKKNKILHSLYKKGYLRRARKGLYYNPIQLKDLHTLALKIKEGYIGLSSALRHYNLIEFEDFTIFVITKNFRKKIKLEGTKYEIIYLPFKNLYTGYEKKNGIVVSSMEKTFFDLFLKPRYGGFSTITKALYEAKIDWKRFISFFSMTKDHALCQRTGYILELMKEIIKIKVPPAVFAFLLKRVKNHARLMPFKGKSSYDKKWKIQDNIGKEKILSWWH